MQLFVELGQTRGPDHVGPGPRQLDSDPRGREGFLEEGGKGTTNGLERAHARHDTPRLDGRKRLR